MRKCNHTLMVLAAFALVGTFNHCRLFGQNNASKEPTVEPLGEALNSDLKAREKYYDLGGFHQKVKTDSPVAQLWFDRGLAMCFAFNHEEAVRCFKKAYQADSMMPMALWGMAYAMGPNMNNMDIDGEQMAKAEFALQLAKLRPNNAKDLEYELIEALSKRHSIPTPPIDQRLPLNTAYADALRKLYVLHPDDSLVCALFAESLLNLQPWGHWTKDGQLAKHTEEIVRTLENGLDKWPDHPALCHFYIHTMEMSPTPEKALAAADRLRYSMPGAGHLVHMPSHIYVLTGDYEQTIAINQAAIDADRAFLLNEGPSNFYSLYRIHNYHFVVYGALFDGQYRLAIDSARKVTQQVPEEMLKSHVDFLDAFMSTPLHVMVRFGRWEDILAELKPADYLPMARSIWHYARSVAFAATNRIDQAETEQLAFLSTIASVPETSTLFNNKSRDILTVAEAMIAGEIEYRKGNRDLAFEHLQTAIDRDEALNYDEPWGWMQPPRHALGALLLEQKRFAEAEAVYRKDLQRRPKNLWSLQGLAESLARQGKTDDAKATSEQFAIASKRCDIEIDRSCFCRLEEKSSEK